MAEEETLEPEIEFQSRIFNSINRAVRIRQENPELFHHAVVDVWRSLSSDIREKLIEKLDSDLPGEEIQDFDPDSPDTPYNLFSCFKSRFSDATKKRDAEIMTGEILLTKIQEILFELGIFSVKRR